MSKITKDTPGNLWYCYHCDVYVPELEMCDLCKHKKYVDAKAPPFCYGCNNPVPVQFYVKNIVCNNCQSHANVGPAGQPGRRQRLRQQLLRQGQGQGQGHAGRYQAPQQGQGQQQGQQQGQWQQQGQQQAKQPWLVDLQFSGTIKGKITPP